MKGVLYTCPECGKDSRVVDIRPTKPFPNLIRRRECKAGHKFSTVEIIRVEFVTIDKLRTALGSTISTLQKLQTKLTNEN